MPVDLVLLDEIEGNQGVSAVPRGHTSPPTRRLFLDRLPRLEAVQEVGLPLRVPGAREDETLAVAQHQGLSCGPCARQRTNRRRVQGAPHVRVADVTSCPHRILWASAR